MTREFAQKYADVINAFMNGKDVQWKNDDGRWIDAEDPLWCNSREYRIKPKSNYRPYANAEEFLKASKEHGPYIKYNDDNEYIIADKVNDVKILISRQNYVLESDCLLIEIRFEDLLNNYVWQDGTSCGILENE